MLTVIITSNGSSVEVGILVLVVVVYCALRRVE